MDKGTVGKRAGIFVINFLVFKNLLNSKHIQRKLLSIISQKLIWECRVLKKLSLFGELCKHST